MPSLPLQAGNTVFVSQGSEQCLSDAQKGRAEEGQGAMTGEGRELKNECR